MDYWLNLKKKIQPFPLPRQKLDQSKKWYCIVLFPWCPFSTAHSVFPCFNIYACLTNNEKKPSKNMVNKLPNMYKIWSNRLEEWLWLPKKVKSNETFCSSHCVPTFINIREMDHVLSILSCLYWHFLLSRITVAVVVVVGHSKLKTVGKFCLISCAL